MNNHLLTRDQVAEYLQISVTQTDFVIASPGFPRPSIIPTRGTGLRPPRRWLPEAVEAWAGEQAAV